MASRPIMTWDPMGIGGRTGHVFPVPGHPVSIPVIVSRHPGFSLLLRPRIFPMAGQNVPLWGHVGLHPDKMRPWLGRFGMAGGQENKGQDDNEGQHNALDALRHGILLDEFNHNSATGPVVNDEPSFVSTQPLLSSSTKRSSLVRAKFLKLLLASLGHP